jgi:DNA polymerase III sliding clamp (beta) subunit (PCNA family)
MIVRIQKGVLEGALRSAARATSPNVPMIAADNFLFRASADDCLQIVGTNLDMGLSVRCAGDVVRSGDALVSRHILAVAKEMPAGDVQITVDGDHCEIISLETGAFFSLRSTGYHEDFPDPFRGEGFSRHLSIARTDLAQISEDVGFAVSHDMTRMALTGIQIEHQQSQILAVATDGKILSRRCAPAFIEPGSFNPAIIIPPEILAAFLASCDAPHIALSLSASRQELRLCSAEDGGTIDAWCRLIDGPYPEWRKVVRADSRYYVELKRATLTSCLRRMDAAGAKAVRVAVTGSSCSVSFESLQTGASGVEGFSCLSASSATALELGIDCELLLSVLRYAPSTLALGINEPLQAIHITPGQDASTTDGDPLLIIMPVRLGD